MISILLDTSYLITLADPARPQHDTATRYLRVQGQLSAQAIVLAQGFDASWFQGGQKPLLD